MTTAVKMYRRSELEIVDQGCLHLYKTVWRDGVDDTSDLSLIGIGFHSINHRYLLRLMQHQTPADLEEARAAFVEGVVAVQTPSRLLPELRNLWDFHAETFSLNVDRFVAAEERQTSGNVSWAPDLILADPTANQLEIVDFKSGWAPPPTEDDLRGLFQARVYAHYSQQRWPRFDSYKFTLDAVRWRKATSVVFTYADLENIERELQAHIATIEDAEARGHWPAVAGPSCRFCSLVCPIESPAQLPKRITSPEMFQRLGSVALSQTAQQKGINRALKAYVAAFGPQDVGGLVYANRPVIERRYLLNDVFTVLETRGLIGAFERNVLLADSLDGTTISHSALSKLFRQMPQLIQDLAPFAQERTVYRFGAKKPGATDENGEEE